MKTFEVNFDGLIGPTHHYGGLAAGNLASQHNRQAVSHPRQAALEGLAKMKLLADQGLHQAVLPPHPRPHWGFLQQHGFSGTAAEILSKVSQERPDLLPTAYSAAPMWAANAGTISPSADTQDGRVHITPANLISTPHRRLETEQTTNIIRQIFNDHRHFVVHDPLPGDPLLADEGAANHMRLCTAHGEPGFEIFVYGQDLDDTTTARPILYPARQSRQASERIAALHDLPAEQRFFLQQTPAAIDAGVFHNDVIAVANENVLLCHESSFINQPAKLQEIREAFPGLLHTLNVPEEELSLEEAVSTYFFNSQLITLPGSNEMLLLCPLECEQHPRVLALIGRLQAAGNPIQYVQFIDVRQSMRNGGGPACLRLRVVLTEIELAQLQGSIFLTESLYRQLHDWILQNYRETLSLNDLADPRLAAESELALMELSQILQLRCE